MAASRLLYAVRRLYEHEGVVHDDAAEPNDAEQADHGDVVSHDDVSYDGADKAEGDSRHDDEWLGEGPEGNGQKSVDQEERYDERA